MEAIVDLKNHGNTVILVEHKKSFLSIADKHIRMGPLAGCYSGEILSQQEGDEIVQRSIPGDPLDDFNSIKKSETGPLADKVSWIEIKGVVTNNLKDVDVRLPKGEMSAVIGAAIPVKAFWLTGPSIHCCLNPWEET